MTKPININSFGQDRTNWVSEKCVNTLIIQTHYIHALEFVLME